MDPFPFEGVQIGRQGRDQGFPFPGHHFGDRAAVKNHPPDQLHVVMPESQNAAAGLAADGERLFQDVVERLAVEKAFAEEDRLLFQLVVGHRLILAFEPVDRLDPRFKLFEEPFVRRAEQGGDPPFNFLRDKAEKVRDRGKKLFEFHIVVFRIFSFEGQVRAGAGRQSKAEPTPLPSSIPRSTDENDLIPRRRT